MTVVSTGASPADMERLVQDALRDQLLKRGAAIIESAPFLFRW